MGNKHGKKPKEYPDEPVVHELKEIDLYAVYSYANYLKWEFHERVELIRGKLFKMAAPGTLHQQISMRLSVKIYNHLDFKCQVFAAPFDVRFYKESRDDADIFTVVQPDICVICNPSKIDSKGCLGAPDIVIEILSPGNNKKELRLKYELYQEYGVQEYWIINPVKKHIIKYVIQDGIYSAGRFYLEGDIMHSDALPEFNLNISGLFT